jgi:predicted Zn-ribbon and HTH transcriptional regulator
MAASKATTGPPKGQLGAVEVTVLACRCRCGHEWITRENERPRVCPKCKSPNWDQPKKWERK